MNGNLITEFACMLCGRKRFSTQTLITRNDKTNNAFMLNEKESEEGIRCQNIMYLIGFIYKYMYEVKTYEEAIQRKDILEEPVIWKLFQKRYISLPKVLIKEDDNGIVPNLTERLFLRNETDAILYFIYHDYDLEKDYPKAYEYLKDHAVSRRIRGVAKKSCDIMDVIREHRNLLYLEEEIEEDD